MVRLPTGYQVVKVTKLPDYMPPAKAAPIVKPKQSNKLPPEEEAIQTYEANLVQTCALHPAPDLFVTPSVPTMLQAPLRYSCATASPATRRAWRPPWTKRRTE